MAQFQFNFEKTYKEVDIAGKVYRIEFNDEAQAKYQKVLKGFEKEANAIIGSIENYQSATDEEIDKLQAEQKALVKRTIEVFLGEGVFDEVYEMAGRSIMNLMELVTFLTNMYVEETRNKAEKAQNKYLANVKK